MSRIGDMKVVIVRSERGNKGLSEVHPYTGLSNGPLFLRRGSYGVGVLVLQTEQDTATTAAVCDDTT
jgi:hypothetical protein